MQKRKRQLCAVYVPNWWLKLPWRNTWGIYTEKANLPNVPTALRTSECLALRATSADASVQMRRDWRERLSVASVATLFQARPLWENTLETFTTMNNTQTSISVIKGLSGKDKLRRHMINIHNNRQPSKWTAWQNCALYQNTHLNKSMMFCRTNAL